VRLTRRFLRAENELRIQSSGDMNGAESTLFSTEAHQHEKNIEFWGRNGESIRTFAGDSAASYVNLYRLQS
jgi:hypothetical protein